MVSVPLVLATALALSQPGAARDPRSQPLQRMVVREDLEPRAALQNIVTWDNHSLMINGERTMIYSGEYHPFRLPVPSLWVDVFQKIKAIGLNTASFYVDWALHEGKPGNFTAQGIFNYTKFFEGASEAGVYLTARPGPYINAEASGGGFPGWLQRINGTLRTTDADYLAATDNYAANINKIIAAAQITYGGPVILYQPENEYTGFATNFSLQPEYMQYVENQARNAGIVVPFMSNDAAASGHDVPGSGVGEVDIYGHDGYPLGFDCSNPTTWPSGNLPTYYRQYHLNQSASTPYAIPEFQGGSYDPWGGVGFDKCAALINQEMERVFYKNDYAAGVAIFSLYMIFGGTNWGNLGHPGGYTSYDYGSVIAEDRTINREKYSELKLQAQFFKVSPGYLTATPTVSYMTGEYASNTDIAVTPLFGSEGSFYVVRHANYSSLASTNYTLTVSTSLGNVTIPQLGGSLTLNGRDSKVHVVDYPVGSHKVIYSSAEVFTWKKYTDKTILVVYGAGNETHEMAIAASSTNYTVTGPGVTVNTNYSSAIVAQWTPSTSRRILQVGDLYVYIVDRNSAYNYWVPELSANEYAIVNGGYLVRSASVSGSTLSLKADFNQTSTIEIVGAPSGVTSVVINNSTVNITTNQDGNLVADIAYTAPAITLPALSGLNWSYINSLPEISPDYDDSLWPAADHTSTNNTVVQPFLTPVSLYGSDYGFNTGALLYRGYFTATGAEQALYLSTQGGAAYASSVWLNGTFVGSWAGSASASAASSTYALPANLTAGATYVLTVLVDPMGLEEDWTVGADQMKLARGILDYALRTSDGTATNTTVRWKMTGNLGGEDYADAARGPLNEGGLFVERQGYHLPAPPLSRFLSYGTSASPFTGTGLPAPGVAFWTAKLALDLPRDAYDVPLRFVFANDTAISGRYRAWLYVNGFQFGRYVSYVGPQTEFPVPEGILDYGGDNWVGLAVYAPGDGGARVPGLELVAKTPVLTGREKVMVVEAPAWTERVGAY